MGVAAALFSAAAGLEGWGALASNSRVISKSRVTIFC
jgi:hypothetical protein